LRELLYLAPLSPEAVTASGFKRITALLSFVSLILAFGLIGIGVIRQYKTGQYEPSTLQRWIKVVLFIAMSIELCLMLDYWLSRGSGYAIGPIQESAHIVTLTLIAFLVVLRHVQNNHDLLKSQLSERQSTAMVSMMSTVKHELNNDMQVVLGNAELAELLMANGDCVKKPISNITKAASEAVTRIEQLSAFSAIDGHSKTAVDLNAIFRTSCARCVEKLHESISLRTELEKLSFRVHADGYLLSMSMSNLMTEAENWLGKSGDILVLSRDIQSSIKSAGQSTVEAEIQFVRGYSRNPLVSSTEDDKSVSSHFDDVLQTTAALFQLAGAKTEGYELSENRAVVRMSFDTEHLGNSTH